MCSLEKAAHVETHVHSGFADTRKLWHYDP